LAIDTAFKTGSKNDYSAFTTWGETESEEFHLLHAWRDRVGFPISRGRSVKFASAWRPDAFLIEDHASGQSLIQLQRTRSSSVPPAR
jgi:phage terminase large subunit-like protein